MEFSFKSLKLESSFKSDNLNLPKTGDLKVFLPEKTDFVMFEILTKEDKCLFDQEENKISIASHKVTAFFVIFNIIKSLQQFQYNFQFYKQEIINNNYDDEQKSIQLQAHYGYIKFTFEHQNDYFDLKLRLEGFNAGICLYAFQL